MFYIALSVNNKLSMLSTFMALLPLINICISKLFTHSNWCNLCYSWYVGYVDNVWLSKSLRFEWTGRSIVLQSGVTRRHRLVTGDKQISSMASILNTHHRQGRALPPAHTLHTVTRILYQRISIICIAPHHVVENNEKNISTTAMQMLERAK